METKFDAVRLLKGPCFVADVEVLSKFAQMEFKLGEPERGKTMFENILNSYPKRTDLWSIYIDMTVKQADVSDVR